MIARVHKRSYYYFMFTTLLLDLPAAQPYSFNEIDLLLHTALGHSCFICVALVSNESVRNIVYQIC